MPCPGADPRIQVSLHCRQLAAVQIIRPDGAPISAAGAQRLGGDGRKGPQRAATAWRPVGYDGLIDPAHWQASVKEAIRQAEVNLRSIVRPPARCRSAWSRLAGHPAPRSRRSRPEGDFNRKKTSAFAGLMGQRVAAPGVTVVDDGTIADRRGSMTVDDEGTPSQRTVLIEDGILTGYMQDRQNARLMGMKPTGNGRRQSYAHIPMPRMTNTISWAAIRIPRSCWPR